MGYQKNKLVVRLFGQALKFSTWLQNLPTKMTPPPFRLLQLGSAFWQSRIIYVAARLDIATVLGEQVFSVDEIAMKVKADPDSLYRLLRMLVAMGIFEEVYPKSFRNNKVSTFLRQDKPQNMRAMVLMHNSPEMSIPWYEQFETGIRNNDVPFRLSHHQGLYDYMSDHPEFSSLFSSAMDSVDALTGDSFATDFNWQAFDRVFDVGGSKGSKSISILKRQLHLTSVVIDAPQVINEAKDHWQGKVDAGILSRLSFQDGDVLHSVPPASSHKDIYFLSAVLHGFDDVTAIKALKNIAAAIGDSGARIVLFEMVLDEQKPDLVGATFDMQIFMGSRGRERTMTEWQRLFKESGLVLEEQVRLRSFGRMLVLRV